MSPRLLGFSALIVLAVSACGQGAAGQAQAPNTRQVAVGGSTAGTVPPAKLDPCALLGPAERSSAGVNVLGVPKEINGARACDWTVPATFGVTITVDERNGLADLEIARKTATKTKIGDRDALKVADKKAADGTCAVLLGMGEKASVQIDVSNTDFTDTPLACERAVTVAGLAEPKLP
ncbi:DUF3558 family protein [Amycolatopsis regifaucium]|uniref:DUF3558 domain-containing protein n=1 Tax=Amycolatopsis regifaucium TaxID=546365 RepID=A0ABX3E037_9PSEU|nr:DUF3558 family protein [Amycolatopsis regifaucium]OKA11187.1 hypothetical protein ATP06_0202830 [Amycolatopsis regifaucium]SFI28285.1 Protein of unknown function [Amycolatopsis regifaucium]